MGSTLYDKVFDLHTVRSYGDGRCQLFIGLHLVHEATSPQAFAMLRERGLMKLVQATLRHASITTTSDMYTSVVTTVAREAAEKTRMIIPRASTRLLGLPSGSQETTMDTRDPGEDLQETINP
ncbi:hypothetical protein [Actinokineospora sp.]|uniref:hypothetical protein n=1 Tax=Actinokineospora sp. TaxID=1872133 RepID=UPI003D6A78F2